MADFPYADQPAARDPLEEAERARAQYTTSRATQTLGDYSYRNPTHPLAHPVPTVRLAGLGGGAAPASGGWGTGGGEAQVQSADRHVPQWSPEWDQHPGRDDEDGDTAGTPSGNGGTPHTPSYGSGRDFNDQPTADHVGASAGEPVTASRNPSPYM
jgi:hypothetical protein